MTENAENNGCENFIISEEASKKLKEKFPGNIIFQRALPQDIGIIGPIFKECEKERIIRHLGDLFKNCGKEGVMTFEEKVLVRAKEKIEKYLREKFITFSLNVLLDEWPVLLWFHQEAEREVAMEEISSQEKEFPKFYPRDAGQLK